MQTEIEAIKSSLKEVLGQRQLLFSEVLDLYQDVAYRDFLVAWGELREQKLLERTEKGLYYIS